MHPVTETALVRQDEIESRQVEPLKSQRVERQVSLVVPINAGEAIHKRHSNRPLAVSGRHLVTPIDGRIDRRIRKHASQALQHVLRAAELVEPIVDDCK